MFPGLQMSRDLSTDGVMMSDKKVMGSLSERFPAYSPYLVVLAPQDCRIRISSKVGEGQVDTYQVHL